MNKPTLSLTADDIRIVDYRITHPQHPKGEHAEIRITTDQPVEVKQQILQALQLDKRIRDVMKPFPEGDFDIDAVEDCRNVCIKIQKFLGEK